MGYRPFFIPPISSTDVLDIFIVSLILFVALRLLQRNVHRRVLMVLSVAALLFWGARTYNWQLTLHFVEGIAIAAGVGFFLVFQEDIRRFLEASLFGAFAEQKDSQSSDRWTVPLLKALTTFSKNRVGAIVVIQQRVPLANLIRGGHRLDGEISYPLLCSLFDPHSEGHDGAVILRHSLVARFGAHLPLSRKYESTGRTGTRHAAALGLSELSDALVIVVSEETGEVSVASHGEFEKVTLSELETKLSFLQQRELEETWAQKIVTFLKNSWALEGLCLLGAFLLWFVFIAPRDLQQRLVTMPVALENIPRDLLTDEPLPSECKVTLLGAEDSFSRWPREKQVVRLSLAQAKAGNARFVLSPSNLSLPTGIYFRQFEPAQVSLQLYNPRRYTVPVVVSTAGRAVSSLSSKIKVEPKEVSVVIRETDPGPTMIMTEPLDPKRLRRGEWVELKLILPAKAQFSGQSSPSVRVTLE